MKDDFYYRHQNLNQRRVKQNGPHACLVGLRISETLKQKTQALYLDFQYNL